MGESTGVRLLGPLEVRVDGRVVRIARPKQRALLAVLALDAGACVSRERLIDELWGAAPPASAAHGLQVHVSGLRKLLGGDLIVTCPGGYKLALDPQAVDAHRAAALVAAGDPEAALALFAGAPLEDVDLEGPAAHEAARLDDVRVAALEERFDRALAAGEGAALVAPLERLVAESPLRERPRGQLMLALYRAGRQADALAAFQDARRTFVEELGIEPSPTLREIERAILQQDDSLAGTPAAPEAPPPTARERRPRMIAGAVAFAALASAAGVAAAYILPPGHPSADAATPPNHPKAAHRRVLHTLVPVKASVVSTTAAPRHRRVRVTLRKQAPVHVEHTRTVPPVAAPTTTHAAPPPPPPPPTTTVQTRTQPTVATHPTRTTPLPPTTTTTPAGPVHIVDTFDGGVVDDRTWNVLINGVGADAVQRNGKLVISIAAGAKPGGTWNFVGAQYGTKQCFTGDIDMQIDYHLVSWPPSSGAYVGLQAVFANALVERFSPPQNNGADGIGSIIDPRFTSDPFSDMSGSLRLTRVNGIATTYYLLGGEWQQVDSAPAPHPAVLQFGLNMNPGLSPSANVSVELDNFAATASGPTHC